MKKNLALLTAALVTCAGLATADVVVQDFEGGTAGSAAAGNWSPSFSGTSTGISGAAQVVSTDQANGGTQSVKLDWTWDAADSGVVRIQPTAAGFAAGNFADHTAEPYTSLAIYGAASGDAFELYMGETDGASPYESFTNQVTVDFTGWATYYWNISTSPATGWVNGDGAIPATCGFCGLFVRQGAAAGAQTLYLDDLQFTAAAPAGGIDADTASVSDWSIL